MAFGLDATGFTKKRLADIKTEIENEVRVKLGSNVARLPSQVVSQLIGVFADREASLWEQLEHVYNANYPDTAEGVNLDNVVALTGHVRQPAVKSTVTGLNQLLFGDVGTLVPAGTVFSVEGSPTSQFETDIDVTLVAGTNEVQNIAFSATPTTGAWKLTYTKGSVSEETTALAFDISAAALQTALNDLTDLSGVTVTGSVALGFDITFAGADGLQPQELLVASSNTLGAPAATITVTVTTPGVEQGKTGMTALETGAITAPTGTLTVIDTPVAGLDSTENIADATVGQDVETDLELRARRSETLQLSGNATLPAIRSKLLNVEGVTAAILFENDTMITDVDGRPAKSYECVVEGGSNADIAETIFASKPAGMMTYGSVTEPVVDSQGFTHNVNFSRPTAVPLWIDVTLTIDVNEFPANGAALAEQAILDYMETLGIGTDVIVNPKLIGVIDTIPGILLAVIKIGTAPAPALSDNITIGPDEIAQTDAAKVTVATL